MMELLSREHKNTLFSRGVFSADGFYQATFSVCVCVYHIIPSKFATVFRNMDRKVFSVETKTTKDEYKACVAGFVT